MNLICTACWATVIFAQPNEVVSVERWPGPPWVEIGWKVDTDFDPETQAGLTSAAAYVWWARANRIPALAQTVHVSAQPGEIWLTAGVPPSELANVLPRLARSLQETRVSDAEADAALARAQDHRRREKLDELALARQASRSELFRGTQYARPASGNLQGLATVSAADLSAFWRHHWVRSRIRIRLVGAVPAEFDWPGPPLRERASRRAIGPGSPPLGRRLIVVDKPETELAVVAVSQWPAARLHRLCGDRAEVERLGFRRVMWWRRAPADQVEAEAHDLLTRLDENRRSPDGCAADHQALEGSDLRRALEQWAHPADADRSRDAPRATVVVVVTGLKAGLAPRLARRLGMAEVSVVPYDLPSPLKRP